MFKHTKSSIEVEIMCVNYASKKY